MNSALRALGRRAISPVEMAAEVLLLVYLSVRAAIFNQTQGMRSVLTVILTQIYYTGWQALPLISVLAVASGSIVIMQASLNLGFMGGGNAIGGVMVAVIMREVAPLLTALIVVARSGTAVASDIGNMRVNREIEALEAMGINPFSYVVFPRIVGGLVSVVCLSIYFVGIAMIGGFIVTNFIHQLPLSFYTASLARAFSREDIWLFLIKNAFGGIAIFTISCHQGFQVQQSPHEVPQVTTKAVVTSVICVVTFNLIVTILFYLSRLSDWGMR